MLPILKRKHAKVVFVIWVVFLARGSFYCVLLPMWEGYDEWAHFAYVQHVAEQGRLPARTDVVSEEVRASLELVPLPYTRPKWPAPHVTHDQFWRLSEHERHSRQRRLLEPASRLHKNAGIAPAAQYEGQQPPLYYLAMALPYLAARACSLPGRILLLRILSVIIASMVVLLGYAIAEQVFGSNCIALLVPILITAFPGLMIDICRVGNDSLTIVLISSLVLVLFRMVKDEQGFRGWALAGVVLGAALLSKAYVLALVPLVPVLAAARSLHDRKVRKKTIAGCMFALMLAAAIAGWWYWRSWQLTGTISGEQLDAAAAQVGVLQKLAAASNLDWFRVLDTAAFSHIWIGGWSFLVVRSWMYRIFETFVFLSLLGILLLITKLVRQSWRQRSLSCFGGRVMIVAGAYVLFCAGLSYHAVVIFVALGLEMAAGWYLYAVIVVEAVLFVLGMTTLFGGLWGIRSVAAVTLLAVALDLYTVHFLLAPYYTGLIAHMPSGSLAALRVGELERVGGVNGLLQRLCVNKPHGIGPGLIAALWAVYSGVTIALGATAIRLLPSAFCTPPAKNHHPL